MNNNLYEALKVSIIGQLILTFALMSSLSFLFCWNIIEAPCSDKFDFKNIVAALISFASLSNLIPYYWYESIGNLFKTISTFISNDEDKGIYDRLVESKPAIISITIIISILIISISFIFILKTEAVLDLFK